MGATLYGASNAMPATPSSGSRRTDTLGLVYQEVLTATVRVRANRQAVNDSQSFRVNIQAELRRAEKDGVAKGYSPEDVRLATTAVVAFLDESVLNSTNSVFSDWSRMPLQQELFGHNVAGESFFENLDRLQNRSDSFDVADLLEIHCICLLLGFKGRYGLSGPSAVRPLIELLLDRIRRIRGPLAGLSPSWNLPAGPLIKAEPDSLIRKLTITLGVLFLVGLLLFIGFKLLLASGTSDLRAISGLIPVVLR
jgi:type VI secretion system protein ImpK